ncbi:hypothetical protein LXL04_030282 [Taraxacum kok-saghyz]
MASGVGGDNGEERRYGGEIDVTGKWENGFRMTYWVKPKNWLNVLRQEPVTYLLTQLISATRLSSENRGESFIRSPGLLLNSIRDNFCYLCPRTKLHRCMVQGTHISNTREAKAFALLSEDGIAKGIRRVTAVTTDYAFEAIKKAAELEEEVNQASKLEGNALEQKVTSLNGQVESAAIPSAKKADLKAKISILQRKEVQSQQASSSSSSNAITVNEREIFQKVFGERRGHTVGIGRKLKRPSGLRSSSTTSAPVSYETMQKTIHEVVRVTQEASDRHHEEQSRKWSEDFISQLAQMIPNVNFATFRPFESTPAPPFDYNAFMGSTNEVSQQQSEDDDEEECTNEND